MTKEIALEWWNKNKDLSEEQYLVANAVTPPMSWGGHSRTLNQMLAKKYPYRLREVYSRALRQQSSSINLIAAAIASSSLPKSRKIDDLMQGVSSDHGWMTALPELRKVDEQLARRLVVERVRRENTKKLPELVWFANEWPIDELWSFMLERARAADVETRLWSVNRVYIRSRTKNLYPGQKRFLLAMLDDASPAVNQKDNHLDDARCYSVQNLAAKVFGQRLGLRNMPNIPAPRDPDEKWAPYRQEARRALSRR
jgi:hypothetical protein